MSKRTNQRVHRMARSLSLALSTWRSPPMELGTFLRPSRQLALASRSRFSALEVGLGAGGPSSALSQIAPILASLELNGRNRKCLAAAAGPRRIDAGSSGRLGSFQPASPWRRFLQTLGSRPTCTWRPGEGPASGAGLVEATWSFRLSRGAGFRACAFGRPASS